MIEDDNYLQQRDSGMIKAQNKNTFRVKLKAIPAEKLTEAKGSSLGFGTSTGGVEAELERKDSVKSHLVPPNFPSNNLTSTKEEQSKNLQNSLMPKCRTDNGDSNFQRILYTRPRSSLRQKFISRRAKREHLPNRRGASRLLKDEQSPRQNTKMITIITEQRPISPHSRSPQNISPQNRSPHMYKDAFNSIARATAGVSNQMNSPVSFKA